MRGRAQQLLKKHKKKTKTRYDNGRPINVKVVRRFPRQDRVEAGGGDKQEGRGGRGREMGMGKGEGTKTNNKKPLLMFNPHTYAMIPYFS